MTTIPALSALRGVLHNKTQRDLWYTTELARVPHGTKGKYAYGSKDHKVIEVPEGYKIGGTTLPKNTPIYCYGFRVGRKMPVAHGGWVYKHQIPGIDLRTSSSVEEKIFSVNARVYLGSETIDRSRKKKLRVRCGAGFYRIVLLNVKVKSNLCFIFGSNIRIDTRKYNIPKWMKRNAVVLPHPARTTRNEVKNKFGFVLKVGRPKRPGLVKIAGIVMNCTEIGALCKISFRDKMYYAHPSIVFPINQSQDK